MIKVITAFLFVSILFTADLQAQSLLKEIEDSVPQAQKISGAFKSTRVINAHSIEMVHKGNLDFRIMHRFGFISDGVKQLYGLDNASMRISFDYGITDNLTVGFGRSTFRKELDLFVKQRILQQSTGQKIMPVSVVVAVGGLVFTEESFAPVKPGFSDRTAYYTQLLIGRKFSSVFSFQLSPIVVHSSTPVNTGDDKTIFAMGGGGRFKISKRMAITLDYHHSFGKLAPVSTDPLSIGVDIETGGHVFQLQFSNATGMNERAYITQTTGKFFKGDIRFGFNLSRMFKIGKK
ncbi:MAG: DUF5777 family beta-barrel protein [Ferruginibacter sp.]